SEDERAAIVTMIAERPTTGDLIPDTRGCRKVRVAGRGKGKSGGYRVITFYGGTDIPVFLLTVFGKGQKSDLSQKERNELAKLTKALIERYGRKDTSWRKRT